MFAELAGDADPHPRRIAQARLRGDDLRAAISGSTRNTILPDDILTKVDRMSMAHAVEVRPAVSRSSHRRIRRHAAVAPSRFRARDRNSFSRN